MISKVVWSAVWLALFALLFAWRAQNLDAFGLSNDEGAHLMWARLAVNGHPLYAETQAVQAPLFIESIGWAFRVAGQTIQAGRWVTLIGFGLLAISISLLAHRAGGWVAATTALILTGISPLIFRFSRLAMAEVPATALAVLSLFLMVLYLENKYKLWLLASGLALGLSFIVKALNPFVALPIGLLLLLRHSPPQMVGIRRLGDFLSHFNPLISKSRQNWRAILIDGLLWGIAVCVPVVVIFMIYEPAAIYDQLIAFRGDLRAAIPGTWLETWAHFKLFLTSHWSFWLLAFGGIISAVLRVGWNSPKTRSVAGRTIPFWGVRHPQMPNVAASEDAGSSKIGSTEYQFLWTSWLLAGVAMLAWHAPLFAHHFIVLLPPLILLAAGLVTNLTAFWPRPGNNGRVWLAVPLLLIIIGAMFNAPTMFAANRQTAAIVTGGREQQALELLRAVSAPDDFLMGDSQLLIFMANRQTPPPLGDVALVAIKAGRQTSANMIALTEAYKPPAVVQWSLRLPWLPDYLEWVEANYLTRRVWDNDHIIYFGRRIPPGELIPNAQTVTLGNKVALRGYELNRQTIPAGQTVSIKLYWQAINTVTEDYTVFAQLLDGNGALVANQDNQPLGGYFPTGQWPQGEIVTDIVQLSLPADLPVGDYTLITGMYLLETLERLPVDDSGDSVFLTTISVE